MDKWEKNRRCQIYSKASPKFKILQPSGPELRFTDWPLGLKRVFSFRVSNARGEALFLPGDKRPPLNEF